MKTEEVEIGAKNSVDIKLATETVKLGEVVVTALASKGKPKHWVTRYRIWEVKNLNGLRMQTFLTPLMVKSPVFRSQFIWCKR